MQSSSKLVLTECILLCFLIIGCSTTTNEFTPIRKIPVEQRKSILFIDFKNNSAGKSVKDYDALSRAIPDMILTDFINAGLFRTITEDDRTNALSELAFQKTGITEQTGLQLGKLAGAELILTGGFTEFNGGLTINSRVVEVQSAVSVAAARVTGVTTELLIPTDKSLIKLASTNMLKNLDSALTEGELEKIKNFSETKNSTAAIENYKGEMLFEKAQILKKQQEKNNDISKTEEIKNLEILAKEKFKAAINEDPDYTRAKNNLSKLISLLPPAI